MSVRVSRSKKAQGVIRRPHRSDQVLGDYASHLEAALRKRVESLANAREIFVKNLLLDRPSPSERRGFGASRRPAMTP